MDSMDQKDIFWNKDEEANIICSFGSCFYQVWRALNNVFWHLKVHKIESIYKETKNL